MTHDQTSRFGSLPHVGFRRVMTSAAMCLLMIGVSALTTARAADDDSGSTQKSQETEPSQKKLVFKRPPPRGAPQERKGGYSRSGPGEFRGFVRVLTPATAAGLSTRTQPVLYWFLSEPTNRPVRVSLTIPKKFKDVWIHTIEGDKPAGLHAIDLAKYDVKLEPNHDYKWAVTIVSGETPKPEDAFAEGFVRTEAASDELKAALAKARPADRAFVYAEHGIWFDALAEVSSMVAAQPENPALYELRMSLLQAEAGEKPSDAKDTDGLHPVIAFDRAAAEKKKP